MFLINVTAILVTANVAWWWIADRLARRLPQARWWRGLTAAFVAVQFALVAWILGGRWLSPRADVGPGLVVSTVAYVWQMLVLPIVLIGAVAVGVLAVAWWVVRRVRGRGVRPAATVALEAVTAVGPAAAEGWTRRKVLKAAVVVAPPLLTGVGVGASLAQLQSFRVRRITVPLANLPWELEGVRIASVSDLHVGTFTVASVLRRVVEATSALNVDLVVMPGDLINNRLSDLSDALDAVVNIQSRHGTFMCIGNHDLIENGPEFVRRAKLRTGLLVDEAAVVNVRGVPVQVLGLPWTRGEEQIGASVRRLAGRVQAGAFPILVAHHPHAFDGAAEAGIPLTFAGHSHGGQLMASENVGFGPWMYRYWSGLYRKPVRDGAALVVSNGVGHWYPVRFGAPAEIIEVTLMRGA